MERHLEKVWCETCILDWFDSETLLSILFGNYGLIADLIDTEHKMQFYCFIARFLYILESVCSSRA